MARTINPARVDKGVGTFAGGNEEGRPMWTRMALSFLSRDTGIDVSCPSTGIPHLRPPSTGTGRPIQRRRFRSQDGPVTFDDPPRPEVKTALPRSFPQEAAGLSAGRHVCRLMSVTATAGGSGQLFVGQIHVTGRGCRQGDVHAVVPVLHQLHVEVLRSIHPELPHDGLGLAQESHLQSFVLPAGSKEPSQLVLLFGHRSSPSRQVTCRGGSDWTGES